LPLAIYGKEPIALNALLRHRTWRLYIVRVIDGASYEWRPLLRREVSVGSSYTFIDLYGKSRERRRPAIGGAHRSLQLVLAEQRRRRDDLAVGNTHHTNRKGSRKFLRAVPEQHTPTVIGKSR